MAELSERGPREEKIGDDTVCKPPTNEEKPSRMTKYLFSTSILVFGLAPGHLFFYSLPLHSPSAWDIFIADY